jgi:hypothetical protein
VVLLLAEPYLPGTGTGNVTLERVGSSGKERRMLHKVEAVQKTIHGAHTRAFHYGRWVLAQSATGFRGSLSRCRAHGYADL